MWFFCGGANEKKSLRLKKEQETPGVGGAPSCTRNFNR